MPATSTVASGQLSLARESAFMNFNRKRMAEGGFVNLYFS
jgi:hypothetical protein